MAAKPEAKAEVASNGEHESKGVTLLKLILESLPTVISVPKEGLIIDLEDLSEKAGMSGPEFLRFLQDNNGLLARTQQASKYHGPAVFRLDPDYKSVKDVADYIKSTTPKRINTSVRSRKAVYRGPK